MAPSPYTWPLFKLHCLFLSIHVLASLERVEIIKITMASPANLCHVALLQSMFAQITSLDVACEFIRKTMVWILETSYFWAGKECRSPSPFLQTSLTMTWLLQRTSSCLTAGQVPWATMEWLAFAWHLAPLLTAVQIPWGATEWLAFAWHSSMTGPGCELSCHLFLLVS